MNGAEDFTTITVKKKKHRKRKFQLQDNKNQLRSLTKTVHLRKKYLQNELLHQGPKNQSKHTLFPKCQISDASETEEQQQIANYKDEECGLVTPTKKPKSAKKKV